MIMFTIKANAVIVYFVQLLVIKVCSCCYHSISVHVYLYFICKVMVYQKFINKLINASPQTLVTNLQISYNIGIYLCTRNAERVSLLVRYVIMWDII